jgi:preprotein translocase subunit SecG
MIAVLLVVHIMVAVALIGVVLLQRSEGGALGIGGGGGGGFMTGRGAGNALTKTTAVLAAMFFATSMGLTMMAGRQTTPTSIFGEGASPTGGALPGLVLPGAPPASAPATPAAPQGPQVPQSN